MITKTARTKFNAMFKYLSPKSQNRIVNELLPDYLRGKEQRLANKLNVNLQTVSPPLFSRDRQFLASGSGAATIMAPEQHYLDSPFNPFKKFKYLNLRPGINIFTLDNTKLKNRLVTGSQKLLPTKKNKIYNLADMHVGRMHELYEAQSSLQKPTTLEFFKEFKPSTWFKLKNFITKRKLYKYPDKMIEHVGTHSGLDVLAREKRYINFLKNTYGDALLPNDYKLLKYREKSGEYPLLRRLLRKDIDNYPISNKDIDKLKKMFPHDDYIKTSNN